MHTSVYDASPPRESVSSAAQTHHGAASAAQSPAGAAAQMHHDAASAAQTPDAADGAKSVQPVAERKKERGKNWTKESSAISVLAIDEANERAPEQSYVDRVAHAAAAYKNIALAVAYDPHNNKYGIKPSDTWVANVAQDIADRISATASAHARKGQTSRILRQAEGIRTVCNNTINGIYKEVWSPDGQISIGKQAADVVEAVRQGLYKVENPTKDTKVPDGWSTIAFDMWVLFGPILIGGRGVSFLQATAGELAGACSFSR
jgi:hypothetical protein